MKTTTQTHFSMGITTSQDLRILDEGDFKTASDVHLAMVVVRNTNLEVGAQQALFQFLRDAHPTDLHEVLLTTAVPGVEDNYVVFELTAYEAYLALLPRGIRPLSDGLFAPARLGFAGLYRAIVQVANTVTVTGSALGTTPRGAAGLPLIPAQPYEGRCIGTGMDIRDLNSWVQSVKSGSGAKVKPSVAAELAAQANTIAWQHWMSALVMMLDTLLYARTAWWHLVQRQGSWVWSTLALALHGALRALPDARMYNFDAQMLGRLALPVFGPHAIGLWTDGRLLTMQAAIPHARRPTGGRRQFPVSPFEGLELQELYAGLRQWLIGGDGSADSCTCIGAAVLGTADNREQYINTVRSLERVMNKLTKTTAPRRSVDSQELYTAETLAALASTPLDHMALVAGRVETYHSPHNDFTGQLADEEHVTAYWVKGAVDVLYTEAKRLHEGLGRAWWAAWTEAAIEPVFIWPTVSVDEYLDRGFCTPVAQLLSELDTELSGLFEDEDDDYCHTRMACACETPCDDLYYTCVRLDANSIVEVE